MEREAQERTEADAPDGGKRHVPYARMEEDKRKKDAPGVEEHDAAGQGLSG